MEKPASKRSKNFKESEVTLLVTLVDKYKDVIECKKTDVISQREKDAAWDVLAADFNNTSGIYYRDKPTLKSKYENLKKNTKKKFADERKHVMGTGGGPPIKTEISETDIKIKNILGELQVMGQTSQFDSDSRVSNLRLQDQQELEIANFGASNEGSWDFAQMPVDFEVEVGLVENPAATKPISERFDGFICSEPPLEHDNIILDQEKPTSSGQFSVHLSPRKLKVAGSTNLKTTPTTAQRKPGNFSIRDLRSKPSSPLIIKKKKSILDTSVAGQKIEAVSDVKKEMIELQKELYQKQIQFLEEEHLTKMKIMREESEKKTKLLNLKIERETLEIEILKQKQ